MYIVKVMKRKDASSVGVAVVLALIVNQLVQLVTGELAGKLSGMKEDQGYFYGTAAGADWKVLYLRPLVSALLQVLALEVLLRVIIWLHPMFVRRGK